MRVESNPIVAYPLILLFSMALPSSLTKRGKDVCICALERSIQETNHVPDTDFIAAGGPENYSWNVIRSEADNLMFQHAGKNGAHIFDGTKVGSLEFVALEEGNTSLNADLGKPVSATWSRKDGTIGVVKFDYLIDANGRAGVVSTKYLKNRKHNQGLKNVASWGYWTGAQPYTPKMAQDKTNQPFFESLSDASGWCWKIPLHNGTTSIGIVQNQETATQKKREMGSPSSKEFYFESLKLAPSIWELLSQGKLITEIKSASDWSYSASSYAAPNVRIVGDKGCFIDSYFSSGVHLALSSALSAATTIRAAQRGDCSEENSANWHSKKVTEGYTRFLLVVLSALKQIRKQDEPVLSDWDEDGFDRAFAFFRPNTSIFSIAHITHIQLLTQRISHPRHSRHQHSKTHQRRNSKYPRFLPQRFPTHRRHNPRRRS